jgi:hypothetical protein
MLLTAVIEQGIFLRGVTQLAKDAQGNIQVVLMTNQDCYLRE